MQAGGNLFPYGLLRTFFSVMVMLYIRIAGLFLSLTGFSKWFMPFHAL